MNFSELLDALQELKYEERRTREENYFEAVISKENLEPLSALLKDYFGAPVKPAGRPPSWSDSLTARPYGGIRQDQTLYLVKKETGMEIVLLWPWGNGMLVTVKVIQACNK